MAYEYRLNRHSEHKNKEAELLLVEQYEPHSAAPGTTSGNPSSIHVVELFMHVDIHSEWPTASGPLHTQDWFDGPTEATIS
ncbi:hypothetical protein Tdes44962_MAKER05273 [Teratosphaeria destructans]|uniref:Uncharacterized protein n=1 Tax=Teratosphaeria destructans TaxID=418781 RepID=A0A9W7SK54_9PEZI|nr:hypothetical protein Tdes44962_MAKER05273 [Teratosphaeria destructans]